MTQRSARARPAGAAFVALLAGALGCAPDPRTELVVRVHADPRVAAAAARLDVGVAGGPRSDALDAPRVHTAERPRFPVHVAIVPLDGDARRVVAVSATATSLTGDVIGVVRARTRFVEGRTLALDLRLEDGCFDSAAACGATLTCMGGTCTDVVEIPVGRLVEYVPTDRRDAGSPDARTDDARVPTDSPEPLDVPPVLDARPDVAPDANALDAPTLDVTGDTGPADTGPADTGPADTGPPTCGNARVEVREACDDGNLSPGDGCSSECSVEAGWVCRGSPSTCRECAPMAPLQLTPRGRSADIAVRPADGAVIVLLAGDHNVFTYEVGSAAVVPVATARDSTLCDLGVATSGELLAAWYFAPMSRVMWADLPRTGLPFPSSFAADGTQTLAITGGASGDVALVYANDAALWFQHYAGGTAASTPLQISESATDMFLSWDGSQYLIAYARPSASEPSIRTMAVTPATMQSASQDHPMPSVRGVGAAVVGRGRLALGAMTDDGTLRLAVDDVHDALPASFRSFRTGGTGARVGDIALVDAPPFDRVQPVFTPGTADLGVDLVWSQDGVRDVGARVVGASAGDLRVETAWRGERLFVVWSSPDVIGPVTIAAVCPPP